MIAEGRYRAVAVPVDTDSGSVWAQFGLSKESKSQQVVVNFEILEGEAAGQKIAWFGYFSDKTVDKTMEALRNCGWKSDDIMDCVTSPLEQEVSLVVEHENDQKTGKPRPRIRWVNRPGGGGLKLETPMDDKDLRMFAAKLKVKAKSIKPVDGAKPDRSAPPSANGADMEFPPKDDDSITW
jgi:hypothetical protein